MHAHCLLNTAKSWNKLVGTQEKEAKEVIIVEGSGEYSSQKEKPREPIIREAKC